MQEAHNISLHPPSWTSNNDYFDDDTMQRIIRFFLINTPCKGVSAREKLLTEYGWNSSNPPKDGYLERRLYSVAGLSENLNLFFCNRLNETDLMFSKAAMGKDFYLSNAGNRIALLLNGNRVMSIFKAIRNSFAHCRFDCFQIGNETYIAMENGEIKTNVFEAKARLLLKQTTLVDWINIIENESQLASKESEEQQLQLLNRGIEAVASGKLFKADDLVDAFHMSKKERDETIKQLKSRNVAEYNRSLSRWVFK